MKQIMLNLISNAVKYTENGSIIFQVERCGEKIRFSVKDTGYGIEKEAINTLFDAFTRVDVKKYRNIEGSGLGLAIVRELCREMDGKVEVQSEVGTGRNYGNISSGRGRKTKIRRMASKKRKRRKACGHFCCTGY
ncbi:MAG: ATP-binding protein [Lachnospiraceae bacterium]